MRVPSKGMPPAFHCQLHAVAFGATTLDTAPLPHLYRNVLQTTPREVLKWRPREEKQARTAVLIARQACRRDSRIVWPLNRAACAGGAAERSWQPEWS